jgi:16S rRNA (guanine966-N2)-methyltransferase
MRVIGGSAKKKKLVSGYDAVRPTSDTTKETLFNLLGDLRGSYFLDLYAGTGSVGIEALSRGADSCIFVERSRDLSRIIRQNIKITGFQGKGHVVKKDVNKELFQTLLDKCLIFDVVFADPPYEKGMLKLFFEIMDVSVIANGGLLVVQHSMREKTAWKPSREVKIGDTVLSLFERKVKK